VRLFHSFCRAVLTLSVVAVSPRNRLFFVCFRRCIFDRRSWNGRVTNTELCGTKSGIKNVLSFNDLGRKAIIFFLFQKRLDDVISRKTLFARALRLDFKVFRASIKCAVPKRYILCRNVLVNVLEPL